MISSKINEDDRKKIVVANLEGGAINPIDNSYIMIPTNFNGSQFDVGLVEIENIVIAGINGDIVDHVTRSSVSEVKLIPSHFSLLQNFPNPFNPTTEIRFDLPSEGHVNLSVYNMTGQKIKSLGSGSMQPGYHSVSWDGTNDSGGKVATGMYFYRIQAGKFQDTKKMLFLK